MSQETLWIGGPDDVRTGDEALDAIRVENDTKHYNHDLGVIKVPLDRWRKAQGYEARGWLHCWTDQNDDRSDEHAKIFNNYIDLKQDLGHVCEVGCGPFTQLRRIIQGRTATKITLLDPLLNSYRKLANCSYKKGGFNGLPTMLKNAMAETLTDFAVFDTIICINVLEHVMDATCVMDNLKRSIKAGGVIIFGEKSHDEFDPHYTFDVGHPIHIKKPLLEKFSNNFQIIYKNGDYFIGTR